MKAKTTILSLALFGLVAGTVASQFDFFKSKSEASPAAAASAKVLPETKPEMLAAAEPRREAPKLRIRETPEPSAQPEGDRPRRGEPRPEPTEEERQARRDEFMARYDTDGDGQLSDAEAEQARQDRRERMEAMRQQQRERMQQAMLERFDINGNGELDESERETARAEFEKRRADFVAQYDTDGDGELNETERGAARQAMRAERERRRMDVNRDGTIDDLDVQAAINRVAGEQRLYDYNRDGVNDVHDLSELIDRVKRED